jgi:hypothetical protein
MARHINETRIASGLRRDMDFPQKRNFYPEKSLARRLDSFSA